MYGLSGNGTALKSNVMIRNYFKTAWRNLSKNKVFSLINILGLTIGITCCIMIFLFVLNEFSVDKFHKKGANIFRVMRGFETNGERKYVPYLSGPYATALLNDNKGLIKQAVRVMPNSGLITFDDKAYTEQKLFAADADFFTLFTFPLLKGDPATVLKEPGSIVLTETAAKKYFGNADPMGKVVQYNKRLQLKVTGIAKDVPSNSHLDFEVIIPLSNYAHEDWFSVWINNNNFTYVLLDKPQDQARIEKTFPHFMDKYMGETMKRFGANFDLKLTPLNDIYFEPYTQFDSAKHGDKKVVFIFLSIAALILLIACINFMNLSTIRAVERSKEVGMRKVMGALRNHLVWQFIGESLLLAIISSVLSIGLLQLLMPWYNELLGYELTVSWSTPAIYLFLLGAIVVVGFLAGSYPAIVLSNFSPIQALKGKLKLGKGGAFFRQALVVVQFSISVLLIIGTIIIMNQMRYIRTKSLGFNQEHMLVIPLENNDVYNQRFAFKNELQASGQVISAAVMSGEPGGFHDIQGFEVEGIQNEIMKLNSQFTDFEYVKTLGLKIIAGRDFSAQYGTDTMQAAIINRKAATQLGFTPEQAIGKWIKNTIRDQERRRIVGVVEDFNFRSLKEQMNGLVIAPGNDNRVMVVKLKSGDIPAAINTIKNVYSRMAPVYPFQYRFLDDNFDRLYKKDVRQQMLISVFSALAIFIACLGLFGLASFTAAKRTKEIGVRKVLGSSVPNIVVLLTKDLLKPVALSILIASPIGYWAMHNWLQNFAYQVDIHWWIFVLAGLIAAFIAVITVCFKAVKAAVVSPVKSLRSE
jgi:putative ABC transport system permease protein